MVFHRIIPNQNSEPWYLGKAAFLWSTKSLKAPNELPNMEDEHGGTACSTVRIQGSRWESMPLHGCRDQTNPLLPTSQEMQSWPSRSELQFLMQRKTACSLVGEGIWKIMKGYSWDGSPGNAWTIDYFCHQSGCVSGCLITSEKKTFVKPATAFWCQV